MITSKKNTITTGVDTLLVYLKDKNLVDMKQVAKDLNTPLKVVQSWTDFLVEENILGVEYKFTNPFIYLIKKEGSAETAKNKNSASKSSFESSQSQKHEYQWKYQVEKTLESKKNFFFDEARKRNLKDIPQLWEVYKKSVTDSQT